jgi:hypothetical protein
VAAPSPGDQGSRHSGWEPELSLLQVTASDVVSATPVLGLPPELSYWSGIVRDGTGWTCALLRPIDIARAPGRGRLLLQTTDGALPLRSDAAGDAAASSAGVVVAQGPSGATLSSRPAAPGAAFRIETDGRAVAWSEGAARSELRGDAVGPALQWSVVRDGGIAYVAQIFSVSGHAFGREVDGFAAVDRVYLPPGARFYVDDPIAHNALLVAFVIFGNRYDDGSVEVGHAAFGHRGWGYAVVNDGTSNRVCTTDVDGAVTTADDGYWPTRVTFTIAGEPWEWLVAPADRMVDLGPMPNPQAAGRMRRVGDDRALQAWFAWGETHPAHGDRREPGD